MTTVEDRRPIVTCQVLGEDLTPADTAVVAGLGESLPGLQGNQSRRMGFEREMVYADERDG